MPEWETRAGVVVAAHGAAVEEAVSRVPVGHDRAPAASKLGARPTP
jgi:hypothetical protein